MCICARRCTGFAADAPVSGERVAQGGPLYDVYYNRTVANNDASCRSKRRACGALPVVLPVLPLARGRLRSICIIGCVLLSPCSILDQEGGTAVKVLLYPSISLSPSFCERIIFEYGCKVKLSSPLTRATSSALVRGGGELSAAFRCALISPADS